ncbi:MAG TPA: PTPA-CTERM sorting domain-containing protein [Nodosilinea sp.]|nr:PTPA-CTERM sorting domain-containing protein [Nodosilinea sp.]
MRNILFQAASVAATVAVATTVSAVMSPEAQALTITRTVGGVSYDITTISGSSFGVIESSLRSQEWWGNPDLAEEFAQVVGNDLERPFFARSITVLAQFDTPFTTVTLRGLLSSRWDGMGNVDTVTMGADSWLEPWDDSRLFATATRTPIPSTPIPTPALLPGLLGLGVSAWRKRNADLADSPAA